jgi:uncharacterized protein YfaA (DUF2138 family)
VKVGRVTVRTAMGSRGWRSVAATRQGKPRSKAARTVASRHMWDIMPATARRSAPRPSRCASWPVPRKLLG